MILNSKSASGNQNQRHGGSLVLWGIDQFPESRSMVFNEACAGDFSVVCPEPFTPAVREDMDGRVCDEWGACGPAADGSQGRWEMVVSMTDRWDRV